jgi:4-hydroxybenzoate polyprenyltransferase
MRSFRSYVMIARPQHMLLAALTTWVAAMLSNGPHWFTTAKVVAPTIMAFSVFGASLFHFGAANQMYTRKSESLAVRDPALLDGLFFGGIASILTAIAITFTYLNETCRLIVVADATIILAYPNLLSRHWFSKNSLIAFVCVSPILIGWLAGSHQHSSIPYGIGMAFFSFLAREIVKDVQDRKANHGYRWTLPLWLGVIPARRIAGACMLPSLVVAGGFGATLPRYHWYVAVPYCLAVAYSLIATHALFFVSNGREKKESEWILMGNACMVATFFLLIFP